MDGVKEYVKFGSGDLNGVFQLFFDNAGTILALIFVLGDVLRGLGVHGPSLAKAEEAFPAEMAPVQDTINDIILGRTLPGVGFSILVGGAFYAGQALMLSNREGRKATALPYGINTPGSFAVAFAIIADVAINVGFTCSGLATPTTSAEATAYAECHVGVMETAWEAGVVTNFLVGLISVALGAVGPSIRKFTPPVALLTSLAGIGIAFLGIGQIANNYTQPLVGLLPLFLTFTLYFGDVSIGSFPKSLLIVIVGTVLGWADGVATPEGVEAAADQVKWWGMSTGFSALGDWGSVGDYLGTVFPVAFAAAAGTLMNVYSAEQAGDKYSVTMTMVSDGVGTIIAAMFGCPFSTSVYIGHPAYKKMGAGAMYSAVHAVFLFIISLTGFFAMIIAIVPQTAVSPLIIFVGLAICAEAAVAAKDREYPAVFLGLIPSLCDWAKNGGIDVNVGAGYYGVVGLSKGAILVALVTTTITVYAINRHFLAAGAWAVGAALLAGFGFIHQAAVGVEDYGLPQDAFTFCDVVINTTEVSSCPSGFVECVNAGAFGELVACGPESTLKWRYMVGYFLVAAMFALMYGLQRAGKVDEELDMDADEAEGRVIAADEDKHMAA